MTRYISEGYEKMNQMLIQVDGKELNILGKTEYPKNHVIMEVKFIVMSIRIQSEVMIIHTTLT